jgi:hypothetical protein
MLRVPSQWFDAALYRAMRELVGCDCVFRWEISATAEMTRLLVSINDVHMLFVGMIEPWSAPLPSAGLSSLPLQISETTLRLLSAGSWPSW